MLKKLILENWKSFRYAELPIDPLTVLIGTNASGKSNAIEALEFLKCIALGHQIESALEGGSVRGGSEWSTLKSSEQFNLKVVIEGEDEFTDYLYSIAVETHPKIKLLEESLVKIESQSNGVNKSSRSILFETQSIPNEEAYIAVLFIQNNEQEKLNTSMAVDNSFSVLNLYAPRVRLGSKKEIIDDIKKVLEILQNIFIFDPIPSKMRSFSPILNRLSKDGFNIAGLLASLPNDEKLSIETTLSSYASHLPERDIQRVWAEPVGRLGSDAMLYCEESWASDEPPMVIDARGMSDGTLRFLAIATALLTRPEGSQLVIEEVDNGLHPSRAELLLKMLKELGAKRNIDILVTTHNPALLDALGLKMVPFVVVAHRDAQTGESKLTPLDDIKHLPKLLASGSVGDLATQGTLEKVLSHSDEA